MACRVKICGISDELALNIAVESGASFIGLVHFTKSPRHVTLARAAELAALLPEQVKSVLVVVNPDDALLEAITTIVVPDYIQLHGDEPPARVADIKRRYPAQKLIKALGISTVTDLDQAKAYENLADMLLFDAKPAELPGGNGIAFDWSIMQGFQSPLPWMLSGGLTPENVKLALAQSGAKMVDVSSGVESAPGVKDAQKISAFLKAAQ